MKKENPTQRKRNWIADLLVALLMTLCLTALLIYDLVSKKISIETNHVIILSLIMLPWLGRFIESFKLSATGLEAIFSRVETLEENEEARLEGARINSGDSESEPDSYTEGLIELSNEEEKVLKCFLDSKYSLRSWSGIKNDANLGNKTITIKTLESLEKESFVKRSIGPKSGKQLWSITLKGYSALKQSG